jgi:hypothetical protein
VIEKSINYYYANKSPDLLCENSSWLLRGKHSSPETSHWEGEETEKKGGCSAGCPSMPASHCADNWDLMAERLSRC